MALSLSFFFFFSSLCTVGSLVRSELGAGDLLAQASKKNPIPGASQPEIDILVGW